jgi:hypothetical protein
VSATAGPTFRQSEHSRSVKPAGRRCARHQCWVHTGTGPTNAATASLNHLTHPPGVTPPFGRCCCQSAAIRYRYQNRITATVGSTAGMETRGSVDRESESRVGTPDVEARTATSRSPCTRLSLSIACPEGPLLAVPAYTCSMTVSRRDRERMSKLSQFLREAESHTPATEEQRRWLRRTTNPKRVAMGLPPLEDDENEQIPELEFFERARERGMLPRR